MISAAQLGADFAAPHALSEVGETVITPIRNAQ